jgi:hypothetical protein
MPNMVLGLQWLLSESREKGIVVVYVIEVWDVGILGM